MLIPLVVTTSDRRDTALGERAALAAASAGVPYVERRRGDTFEAMLAEARALLVFEASRVTLVDSQGSLRFSPGLAQLRVKQIDRGLTGDRLLALSGLQPGEQVLDCTLGLAGDALVAARAVGKGGVVRGLERSLALSLLAKHGLAGLPRHPQSCAVEVVRADAAGYLSQLPARSFDVVLFDPMFERVRKASPAFEILRRHADYSPLTPETLAQARRVARRAVIVKGSPYSSDLAKLGLRAEPGRRAARVVWARVPADGGDAAGETWARATRGLPP